MANLIITIISIAIVGIAAAMAIYYGGLAYENQQINTIANTIMNEAQQIGTAERLWSSNNGCGDMSCQPGGNISSGGVWQERASGTGISALVNGGELSNWRPIGSCVTCLLQWQRLGFGNTLHRGCRLSKYLFH